MIAKPKKLKKTPLKKLKVQLDKLMSELVILRDASCVTCGKRENLTNGHLLTRGHMSTRWNLKNCNCQCVGCNFYHEKDPSRYTSWFLKVYGVTEYEKLRDEFTTIKKWNREALQRVESELKSHIAQLKTIKNVI